MSLASKPHLTLADFLYPELAKVPEKLRWCDITERFVSGLRGPRLEEVTALPGEIPEIKRQDTDQQDFYIVDEVLISNHVPAEAIPRFPTAIALVRCSEALPDVPLADVDRC